MARKFRAWENNSLFEKFSQRARYHEAFKRYFIICENHQLVADDTRELFLLYQKQKHAGCTPQPVELSPAERKHFRR